MHELQAEYSRPPHTLPPSAVTSSTATHTTQSTAHPGPPPLVETHPPLSAFPAPPAVVPATSTSTTTSTTATTATTANASVVTVQDVSRLKGMSTAGVVTAATEGSVGQQDDAVWIRGNTADCAHQQLQHLPIRSAEGAVRRKWGG